MKESLTNNRNSKKHITMELCHNFIEQLNYRGIVCCMAFHDHIEKREIVGFKYVQIYGKMTWTRSLSELTITTSTKIGEKVNRELSVVDNMDKMNVQKVCYFINCNANAWLFCCLSTNNNLSFIKSFTAHSRTF